MSRARAFLVGRADQAGGSNAPWLILSVLVVIELLGTMPITATWPEQIPGIARGIAAVSKTTWDHAGGVVRLRGDPLGAWATDTLPKGWRWVGVAAVPPFLTLMLAIVRERRAMTLPTRALRLVAAGSAYLVVALYCRHLFVTLLQPLAVGLLSVHVALLAVIVAGLAVLIRVVVGRPAKGQSIVRHGARDRLRAGLVLLLAVGVGVLLVGLLPLPT